MFAFEISQLGCTILYVPQPSYISEHCSHVRAEFVCARDWAVLRTMDADGAWRSGSCVNEG